MTQPRDIERLLDQWFADGSSVAPDRIVDVVADRIERQPQRPAWRLDWRHLSMTTTFKLATAVAAIAIVAVLGYSLLPGRSTGVGGPAATPSPTAAATTTPTAAPTAAPSAVPSPGAVFPAWYKPNPDDGGAGILTAGSHATRSFVPALTYTVPAGWVNDSDGSYFGLFPDTPANQAEFARSGETADGILMGSHDSPYFVCPALENNRGTAAEMAAAAAANDILMVSDVVDVTVGGLTGKRFDVRINPDWDGTCPGDPPGSDYLDGRTRTFLLDVPGRGVLVIFVGSKHAASHEAFLAPATQIVESFDFAS